MKFTIEITDTFGGEVNYSWVRRYECTAKSMRGAIIWLARNYGAGWCKEIECGDYVQYKMRGACIVAFINYAD
jgi:hypothetical protein